MSTLNRELVFLILQFCDEEGFKETAHRLERESGFYFDMKYFGDMVLCGNWDEAERYLSGFTKFDDNKYSTKIYFEMRKQKYFEALDNNNHSKAVDILRKELIVFEVGNEELFKEITQLLTLNDIRNHISLSSYGNTRSAREILICELKKIIMANPIFHGKLTFPSINSNRLRRLLNQSLNWQHALCQYPQPIPHMDTLFVDHVCPLQQNHSLAQSTENNLGKNLPQTPCQATPIVVPTSPECCNSGPSTESHSTVAKGATCPSVPSEPAVPCHKGSVNDSVRSPNKTQDEVKSTVTYHDQSHNSVFNVDDDLPKTVARTLDEGSSPMSMDFHPFQQTVLLVGTSLGDVGLWEVKSGEKLLSKKFKIWDIGACSAVFKAALVKDPCICVNRIMWSPDGSLFGVAYSKHIVQLYSHHVGNEVRRHLEIDSHIGGVNDLAFSIPAERLLVITCGDDKKIKVWDATTGAKRYTFDGHDAPVYSVFPHTKECVHFIFSTSVDGKIKAWLYDDFGSRINYDTPGLGCTTMVYSNDGKRLFSCGTNKGGESFLVEWNESEGSIKRTYKGLDGRSLAAVQCDTSKNQILAVGDDHTIKLWDMNDAEILTTINGDGSLAANPRIRFNKEGTLLAVSANENRIKILATSYGLQLLQTLERCSDNTSKVTSKTSEKVEMGLIQCQNGETRNSTDVNSKLTEEESNKSKDGNLYHTSRSVLYRYLRLPSQVNTNKISKLMYTNAGNAILALGSNGIHLLWKWPKNDLNLSGKASTEVLPQLWQPRSGLLMTNDLTGTSLEGAQGLPCVAVSRNDSYLISTSGGMISLFNMISFKKMLTVMNPPPAATCIAFHPQDNNFLVIGMDDSTILIYHVRIDKLKSKLEGHASRVTGLSFSDKLNVLISSGADAQIILWNIDGWKKQNSRSLDIPIGEAPAAPSNTHVQFHQDQTHFLTVHDTHLAIYEAKELRCLQQRNLREAFAPLCHATYSSDCQMVYASFSDGTVYIFDGLKLEPKCQINLISYLSPNISSNVYAAVIAAHPQIATQFAVGLSDGGVFVLEPKTPGGEWSLTISSNIPKTEVGDSESELSNLSSVE